MNEFEDIIKDEIQKFIHNKDIYYTQSNIINNHKIIERNLNIFDFTKWIYKKIEDISRWKDIKNL